MRFRGIESPCLECPDRHINCHSKCEKFQKYREEHERALKKWKEEKTLDGVVNHLNYESSKRLGVPEPLKHGRKTKR